MAAEVSSPGLLDLLQWTCVTAGVPSSRVCVGDCLSQQALCPLPPLFPLAEVLYALTAIPGVGRRISDLILKKAEVDQYKRAGEMTEEEIGKVVAILQDPKKFNVPDWMLNRRVDRVDGSTSHVISNQIAIKMRDDLEALKKSRAHRGLRHFWGLKVRGQHTGTTGRGYSAMKAAMMGK